MNRKNRFVCFSSKWLLGVLLTFSISVKAVVLQDSALITINANNIPIEQVFRSIESQTNYSVFYNTKVIDPKEKVSVNVSRERLTEAMDKVLKGRNLKWVIKGKGIIIMEKNAAVPAGTTPVQAAERVGATDSLPRVTVSGTVTSDEGFPLPGATVIVNGGKIGTTTDGQGRFSMGNVPDRQTVTIRYTGYQPQDYVIRGSERLVVQLKRAVDRLDETVIMGYGTTTRRYNTGSISKIPGEDIRKQPVTNPMTALQGRAPGLFITQTTGLPGSPVLVQIRGRNSITAGNEPLYIIDGVPFPGRPINENNSSGGANGFVSPFNTINSSDIESVEILKDADATAIYGSRAANGVILITTTRGKQGKAKLHVNVYSGAGKVTNMLKMLNTQQYLEIRREAFKNDNVSPTIAADPDLMVWDQNAYTDWQKFYIGGTAKMTDAQVSISSGSETTRFLLGGNFHRETTVYPGDFGYYRGGGHFNIDHTSTDKKLGITFTGNYTTDNNKTTTQDFTNLYNLAPNMPVYDKAGNLDWTLGYNPIAALRLKAKSQTSNLIFNSTIKYEIMKQLKFKVNLGFNDIRMEQNKLFPKSANPPTTTSLSSAWFGNSRLNSYIIEPTLDYTRELFNGKLTALLGGTWQYQRSKYSDIQGQNYANESLLESLAAAGTIGSKFYTDRKYKYASGFGRLNYIYADKYIVNASFRRDGSSRFGPNKRFGDFYGISGAWLFSNENFIRDNISFLSFGKLRGSYGSVGSDRISDYQYLSTYTSSSFSYAGNPGLTPSRIANSSFSWEVTKKLEFSLELGLLKDRIFLSSTWYKNESGNQLINYALPVMTGAQFYNANFPALVVNKGLEFELNTTNIKTKNFTWSSAINLTIPKNELAKFPTLQSSSYASQFTLGKSLTLQKGMAYGGIDPQTGAPIILDIDKNGTIGNFPGDYIDMGNLDQKYYGGFSNSFTYANFTLDFLFQFVKKDGYTIGFSHGTLANQRIEVMNRWTKPGDITNIPAASATAGKDVFNLTNAYLPYSNYYLEDASYIRLKNLSLSYDLNIKSIKSRIYVQGQNLLTITDFSGLDPETNSSVGSMGLPPLKMLTAGIQLSL
ncbi:TonB-linked outer membrane protein, SusC/RagA family [Chitinophaga niabensis]|uniref:TonB-linked outer membrane protein, SusC/RagA family n=2 Tax=Chitinophaga niabensis TaxID=536979 RepID=A0A1N6D4Z6_9BACT|nr:TonB-linked outer membrane protein, SusC/RagA family [Chitinophaga niabensis]